jgi:hypothetical protein
MERRKILKKDVKNFLNTDFQHIWASTSTGCDAFIGYLYDNNFTLIVGIYFYQTFSTSNHIQ